MAYVLYFIGAAAISLGLAEISGAKWNFVNPDAWYGCFVLLAGIVFVAVGRIIELLKHILDAIRDKR